MIAKRVLLPIALGFVSCGAVGNLSAQQQPFANEAELAKADSEVFATLVSLHAESPADSVPYGQPELEIDSRPWGESKTFRDVAGGGTGLASKALFYVPDSLAMLHLTEIRKRLLSSMGRREGNGFSFPECGGSLAPPPPPANGTDAMAQKTTLHSGCPATNRSYLNLGIPFHGVPETFKNSRKPIDTAGDVWTVVANEHHAGPNGQNWFQNAIILRRDPVTRRLRVTQRVLLSWAE